jgi:hypothetical protein
MWHRVLETIMHTDASTQQTHIYMVRFESLFREGRGMEFPCDAVGHVNLDELSDRVRSNYLFARVMVGREYAVPRVRSAEAGW